MFKLEGTSPYNSPEQEIPKTLESLENPGITHLKALISQAEAVLNNKYIYAEEILLRTHSQLAELEYSKDPEIESLRTKARELMDKLPVAEVENFIARIQESLDEGEIDTAKRWHKEASDSLKYWVDGFFRIEPTKHKELKDKIDSFDTKLYKFIV